MERYGKWNLVGAAAFLSVGIFSLAKGVGPEWYSYIAVVLAFLASAAWIFRYAYEVRKAKNEESSDHGSSA
ncbi:hypothetical protein [Microbacterium lacticum]|uniref:Uncharacterized protein n=1 Tax=Microbacterium lacticum TaxID=33885 RepID=A0A4Y3URR1_9MICO|nr:hypothetical protein [Microbacterium lacticum]TQM90227.1 hypothetical protein FHX68_3029 [Microbacterium lacticum]GEB96477.1 hypothetical protein MLA01_26960 [Microbacterium lacticum]GGN11744.1 hypothetical protein GCM10009724_01240 [Microbacterium lacticum]